LGDSLGNVARRIIVERVEGLAAMTERVDVRLFPRLLVFLLDEQGQVALEKLLIASDTTKFCVHGYIYYSITAILVHLQFISEPGVIPPGHVSPSGTVTPSKAWWLIRTRES